MCGSRDFTFQDTITDGCTTLIGEDRVVMCRCDRLTNFAVLVVMSYILIVVYHQNLLCTWCCRISA